MQRCGAQACPPPSTPHTHHEINTQIPGLEVWFQRASDVVRKLRLGDIDLGIVGYDMFEVREMTRSG